MGGEISDNPTAVSWGPNRLDIFVTGKDHAVYHKVSDGAKQWYPSLTGWEDLGGVFYESPTVVSWGPGRLDIFVRGEDHAVWHKAWDEEKYKWDPPQKEWHNLGGAY